jgi:hypothetical protein
MACMQVLQEEAEVVAELRRRLDDVQAESSTSLEDDVTLLAHLRASGSERGDGDAAFCQPELAHASSSWLQVALEYRVERKRLADAARALLDLYDKIIEVELR